MTVEKNYRAEVLLVILGAVEKAMEEAKRENNAEFLPYWAEKHAFFVEKYEEALTKEA